MLEIQMVKMVSSTLVSVVFRLGWKTAVLLMNSLTVDSFLRTNLCFTSHAFSYLQVENILR